MVHKNYNLLNIKFYRNFQIWFTSSCNLFSGRPIGASKLCAIFVNKFIFADKLLTLGELYLKNHMFQFVTVTVQKRVNRSLQPTQFILRNIAAVLSKFNVLFGRMSYGQDSQEKRLYDAPTDSVSGLQDHITKCSLPSSETVK